MVKRFYSLALLCLTVLTVAAQGTVTIVADPADGSTVEKLSSVLLTFEGAASVDNGSKANSVTITSDKGYAAGCTLGYGDADNQMVVSFTEVTEDATYTLTFPENAFSADVTIPAFTLTYKIGEEAADGLLLTPDGGTVTWLSDITIVAAAAPTKSLSTVWGATEEATLTGPNGEQIVIDGNSVYDSATGYSTYHITPRLLITTPGEYTLTIPDGYFYYYDDSWQQVTLPGATATYNVTGGQLEVFTANPSKDVPVSQFQTLVITFPNATTVAANSAASIVLYQNAETWKGSASLNFNWTFEGNTMTYSVYSPIIDAGHYTMNFPEGCLLLDGEPNAPFMVEFDIVENEPLNMVVTPAEGADVEGILNSAVITFPDETDVTYNPGTITLFQVTETGNMTIGSAYGTSTTVRQDDGKTFVVNFPGIATKSGTYQINIPKNLFTTGERFNAETNITFNYTTPETVQPVVTPADGAELDRVQSFTVTFPTETDVTVNTAMSSASIYLYKGVPYMGDYGLVKSTHSTVALSAIQQVDDHTFSFSFGTPGIEAGEYALEIPAGVFLIGDRTFNAPVAYLVYTATGNGLDKIEATPAEPVASLKDITLTFANESSVVFQSSYASTTLYKVNPDASWDDYKEAIYNYESTWGGFVSIDENQPNKLNIVLMNEYTEEGEYYLELGTYFLYMSDGVTPNTVNKVYFTVDPTATAINDVRQPTVGDSRIYTINGVEVKDMSRKGLYIQNGKKIIKK